MAVLRKHVGKAVAAAVDSGGNMSRLHMRRLRPTSNVFRCLLRLDVGHEILLLEQILFKIVTAGLLRLSYSVAGHLSLQSKQFRLLLEIGFSIMDSPRDQRSRYGHCGC